MRGRRGDVAGDDLVAVIACEMVFSLQSGFGWGFWHWWGEPSENFGGDLGFGSKEGLTLRT